MNPQLPTTSSHYAQCTGIKGVDGSNTTEGLSSLTVTIDDYASAFVSPSKPSDGVGFYVQSRAMLGVGVVKTVNCTVTGKSLDGTVLPSQVVSIDIVGAPPPPQAVALVVPGVSIWGGPAPNGDPGSATATII